METVRLTTAQAMVRFLVAQRCEVGGAEAPLFPGVFAIFGHGNVTCLGEALEAAGDRLPTWRGQNEQGMAMAAMAFAKAVRRRQVMIATSSIGPGALNMVTAAGIAMANRLPVLLISGDTFASRLPDPVLQQVERFDDPTLSVNDAFKPVVRFWDRIVHPAQVLQSPRAVAVLLDPADCGPVFLGMPQDVQAEAYDYPVPFFADRIHTSGDPARSCRAGAAGGISSRAERPLVIAGGGVRYRGRGGLAASVRGGHRLPVAETVAGKGAWPGTIPPTSGPSVSPVDQCQRARRRYRRRGGGGHPASGLHHRVVDRLRRPALRLVSLNTARFDAAKHLAVPLVGDAAARAGELWRKRWPTGRPRTSGSDEARSCAGVEHLSRRGSGPPTTGDASVVPGRDRSGQRPGGGGRLRRGRRRRPPRGAQQGVALGCAGTFDSEYGFCCMGYEIGGAWGAAMAKAAEGSGAVISICGDGSYLMPSSDVYCSVLSGHKFIVVLCDNGGYSVIDRLQAFKGGASFNNMLEDTRAPRVGTGRLRRARRRRWGRGSRRWIRSTSSPRPWPRQGRRPNRGDVGYDRPSPWTGGDAWWDVGVPEVSEREEVLVAKGEHEAERKHQRIGV